MRTQSRGAERLVEVVPQRNSLGMSPWCFRLEKPRETRSGSFGDAGGDGVGKEDLRQRTTAQEDWRRCPVYHWGAGTRTAFPECDRELLTKRSAALQLSSDSPSKVHWE